MTRIALLLRPSFYTCIRSVLFTKSLQPSSYLVLEASIPKLQHLYAILKLLLSTYPTPHHIEGANHLGNTLVHLAAMGTNLTAIQIIYDHLDTTGQDIDINRQSYTGATALDILEFCISCPSPEQERHASTIKSSQLRAAKTYEYLRNRGACRSSEQQGILTFHAGRLQTNLTKRQFIHFLSIQGRNLGIRWEYVEVDIEDGATGTEKASFVLDFCWRFDQLILQGLK
ncbi:hypothetical protein F4803DRAFT_68412 [Xylaria telfairii]|nr:hypothetical protein F4803DRAFT_68412 [Xylaria telfairii]